MKSAPVLEFGNSLGCGNSIFRSMQNLAPSHLLDRGLFDFAKVRADGAAQVEGDKAFDTEEFAGSFVEPASAQVIKFR